MSRNLEQIAVLLLAAALVSLAVSACGGGTATSAATKAAGYAGLWVNPEFNNEIWLHATARGNAVTLRWQREWSQPVTQPATAQADGSLRAAAVRADFESGSDGEPAFTGRLTSSGGLDMMTTTHVAGVDSAIPVTLNFERGSQAKYAAFAARMNKNLEEQRVSDEFGLALNTINEGVSAWRSQHGRHKAPPVTAVRPGGAVDKELRAEGKTWPRLSDGSLVRPGTGRGQYIYRTLPNGYRLSGRAENGQGPMTLGSSW